MLLAPNPFPAYAVTTEVEVVSLGASGQQVTGTYGSISGDGRFISFTSATSTVVPGDTNGKDDVFVRDLVAGVTERVSVGDAGQEPNDYSTLSGVSNDGRFVVFYSVATNLVADDLNGYGDVFVRDRENQTTILVSRSINGGSANQASNQAMISGDGHFITYLSQASDLVSNDPSGANIFVFDIVNGTNERVDVSSDEVECNIGGSGLPSISADGRFVVFSSSCTNLVSGDTNGKTDFFIRDRVNGTTERVSVMSDGAQNYSGSISEPLISPGGDYIAFVGYLFDPFSVHAYDSYEVYVKNLTNGPFGPTGTIERVTVSKTGGRVTTGVSNRPSIDASGRYVLYQSNAGTIVNGDTNNKIDVFAYDRVTKQTVRLSVSSTGAQIPGDTTVPRISSDGVNAVFMTQQNYNPTDIAGWKVYLTQVSRPIPVLSVEDQTATYASTTPLRASLSYKNAGLAGKTLTFKVNGQIAGAAVTDSAGNATLDYYVTLGAGTYPIEVEFAGDDDYYPVSKSGTLTVIRQVGVLSYTGDTVAMGGPFNLKALLSVNSGTVPQGASLTFTLAKRGEVIGTYSGELQADWTAAVAIPFLPSSPYTVSVSLSDNPYYEAPSVTALIKGVPKASVGVQYSDTTILPATLTAGDGGIAGRTLHVSLNSVEVGSATTDANGAVAVPYLITIPAGTYPLQSEFYGDDEWSPSTATSAFVITPETGILTYSGSTTVSSGPVTLAATLTQDNDGTPGDMSLTNVRFNVTNRSTGAVVSSSDAPVNATGGSSLSVALDPGSYLVTLSLIGNGYFEASTCTSVLTVAAP